MSSTTSRAAAGLAGLGLFVVPLLAGCDQPEHEAAPVRPVRTVAARSHEVSETVSQVGDIQARTEIDIGFRIEGKITRRPVDVGSRINKGDLLAQLDETPTLNRLHAAEAELAAAEAEHVRTQAEAVRQSSLLTGGYTTKQRYETALRDLQTAEAQVEAARTKIGLAKDNLGYAELHADTDGVVTEVYADAGQVVTAGQRVVRLADSNESEAVFGMPATALRLLPIGTLVDVVLTGDDKVTASATVRYVSPQADPVTRTYTVRVLLKSPPAEMRLGSTVTGRVKLSSQKVVELPGVALVDVDGNPAVWVFDKANSTVGLKQVSLLRHESETVLLSGGLDEGDLVVTAGIHVLYPGQHVRLLADSAR